MSKETHLSRRRFLVGAGAATGASIVACSGLGMWATAQPAIDFKKSTCIKESNVNKILVAYASRAGATGEVADAIGQVLCETGAAVEVSPVNDVTNLDPYQAVVLGSAIYMGSWMPAAVNFLDQHRQALSQIPVATFTVSMLMVDRPEEHQQLIAKHFTESEQQPRFQPVSNAIFAGRIAYDKLSFFYRSIAKMMKAEEQDKRDWPAIQGWARSLASQLVATV
jgi:menaquinone-dependent protoporphyrinogen oxidase